MFICHNYKLLCFPISEARNRFQIRRGHPAPGLPGGAGERRQEDGGGRSGGQDRPVIPPRHAEEGVQEAVREQVKQGSHSIKV